MRKRLLFWGLLLTYGLLSGCHSSSQLEVSGFIEGEEYLSTTLVEGKVERVLVQEGQQVKEGEPLAELDSEKLRVALKKAEAAVAVLDAELDRVNSLVGRLPKGGSGVSSNYYHKLKKLYDVGGISRAQLNRAKRAKSSGYRRSQAEVLQKELESKKQEAEAHLEELITLAETTLMTAPADGIVTKVYLKDGQLFKAGAPAFLITDLQQVFLKSSLSTRELGSVTLGQKVPIKVRGLPERTFTGELTWIASDPDPELGAVGASEEEDIRYFPVKIRLDNSKGIFKPGMLADATFQKSTSR